MHKSKYLHGIRYDKNIRTEKKTMESPHISCILSYLPR